MNEDGHTGLNALLFLPFGVHLMAERRLVLLAIGTAVVIGCSSLPDIDHRLPITHRGVTHTVWFAALVGLCLGGGLWSLGVPSQEPATVGWGVTFGALTVLGHLLGDALTPWGVEPFAPVSGRTVSLDLVNSGNAVVNRGFLVVGCGLFVGGLGLGAVGVATVLRPISRALEVL